MSKMRFLFGSALLALSVSLFGCGDTTDSRLSGYDVAYLKALRYQAMYGTATSSTTSTATVTITSSSVTTITASSSH